MLAHDDRAEGALVLMRPAWFPDWSGMPCVVVASGPSAIDHDMEMARGRAFVLAVNSSWRLAPWADALYACDPEWWESGEADGFAGMRISRRDAGGEYKIDLSRTSRGLVLDPPGTVTKVPGSGIQAANLAVQFGATRIGLIGFDASVAVETHWHGKHRAGLKNPSAGLAASWRESLDAMAAVFAEAGVEVVNISATSALTAYPRATLAGFLDMPETADDGMVPMRFTADFYWTPARQRSTTFGYKAGMTLLVPRACAVAALNRRAAVRVPA